MTLISLHLPKTAGSSFGASLESRFGDALALDYSDRPVNHSPVARNFRALRSALTTAVGYNSSIPPRCIHGHFMPLKYRWARFGAEKQFVVWLRDPVERLASHYHYWTRDYEPETAGQLRRRVVEEGWSLERFCFSRELQNIYTRMCWGFPFERFDFVGITENYEADLTWFARRFLDTELAVNEVNVNPEQKDLYIKDQRLRSRIEEFHSRDMELYKMALEASLSRG